MDRHTPEWTALEVGPSHEVLICDATTGHTVRPVAFCDTDWRARDIIRAVNSYKALLGALRRCEARFQEYATHHRDRGATEKADRNEAIADMCREVLTKATARQPAPGEGVGRDG